MEGGDLQSVCIPFGFPSIPPKAGAKPQKRKRTHIPRVKVPGGTYATHGPSHGSRGGPQRTLAPSAHLASRAVDGRGTRKKLGSKEAKTGPHSNAGTQNGVVWGRTSRLGCTGPSPSNPSACELLASSGPKGRKTEAPRLGFPNPRKRSTRPRVGLDSLILFGGDRLK